MTTTTAFEKSIHYDRQSKDFACYLDGEFVGYAASYSAGEALLDQIAYDLLADGAVLSAAQLELTGPQPFPFAVSALLAEADRVMADIHYAAVNLSDRERCPFCCGPHAAERCPLKRRTHQLDLVVRPRHCANCDGPHSIQQCPAIRAALFAPSCPRCGGRHALADCPQRGPAEPGMLTSQGSLASRCRIEPADDNLEYVGFLDGVLVGIYPSVVAADLALANLAWASDHGLIARVQRCPGAAV